MSDIVLLQLPVWAVGCPPLGLGLLKSYLAEHGISSKIFDINAHLFSISGDRYKDYWEVEHGYNYCSNHDVMLEYYRNNRALFLYYIERIHALKPKIVGCSCFAASIELTKIFLEDLRNFIPGYKHLLGGPEVAGFTNSVDQLISKKFIDAICLDEGEISLVKYFQEIEADNGLPVPGLIYKRSENIIKEGPREYIKNLDTLPFPDFSDFNLKRYQSSTALPSYATRGCINKCIYCSARSFMKPFRFRSGKRMFEEVEYLKIHNPDLTFIRMADNISNGNIKELETFCDLMIKAKLGVKWNLENAVIRKEMRTPLYKKMKKAGCTLVGYGLETPSPSLLQKIGKVLSKDVDIAKVLKEGKKAGLYISVNIMFGLPGETEEDFDYLLQWLRANKKAFDMVNPSLTFCEFYPGCLGYERPDKYGIDLGKGTLFWETTDKTNTYIVRMERFEKFCRLARDNKLDNLFNVQELLNKNEMLFRYYFESNQNDRAIEYYDKMRTVQKTPEIINKYRVITDDGSLGIEEKEASLINILPYRETFEKTFISAPLADSLGELENAIAFEVLDQKEWKQRVRSVLYGIMKRGLGYDTLEKKISNCYSMMKVIDAKIRCYDRCDDK